MHSLWIGASVSFCAENIALLVTSVWMMPMMTFICWVHAMQRTPYIRKAVIKSGSAGPDNTRVMVWDGAVVTVRHNEWVGG